MEPLFEDLGAGGRGCEGAGAAAPYMPPTPAELYLAAGPFGQLFPTEAAATPRQARPQSRALPQPRTGLRCCCSSAGHGPGRGATALSRRGLVSALHSQHHVVLQCAARVAEHGCDCSNLSVAVRGGAVDADAAAAGRPVPRAALAGFPGRGARRGPARSAQHARDAHAVAAGRRALCAAGAPAIASEAHALCHVLLSDQDRL